jgi:hypothetical protein
MKERGRLAYSVMPRSAAGRGSSSGVDPSPVVDDDANYRRDRRK